MEPEDKKFAMNCLDYFRVAAMAGVEGLKFLRNGAGNRGPKQEWIRSQKCDPAYVRSKDERYSSRQKTFEHVIFFI